MKKMIVIIVIAVVGIFLGVGLYNASKLQHIHIQKEVRIKADLRTVFDHVVYLSNFPKWSPFLEADPGQKIEIRGEDGKIGTQYHWDGNKGKDLGYQEIKEIDDLKYIKMACDIKKPFEAKPTFEYAFKQTGEMVTVTQDFEVESEFVSAFFMWLFGAKKEMGKVNARGMELLKEVSEK